MSLIDFFTKTKIPIDDRGFEFDESTDNTSTGNTPKVKKKVDDKTKKLLKKWDDLEKDILADEVLIKVTIEAFKQLEEIFDYGKKKGNNRIVGMYKSEKQQLHGEEEWLRKLLYLKLKRDKREKQQLKNISGIHALSMSDGNIAIFRSSLLYRFLEQTGAGKGIKELKKLKEEVRKLEPFNEETDITQSYWFREKEDIRKAVDEVLRILKNNFDYLEYNKKKIREDGSYTYTLINVITHEIIHKLWDGKSSNYFYRQGMEESWTHILQVLRYLYDKKIVITEELLNKEIKKIYALIKDKSKIKAYAGEKGSLSIHTFMSAFMWLFGALVLIDVILRKEGKPGRKFLGRKYFNLAFRSTNIHQIYLWTLKSLEKLDNKRLKDIIHESLIKEFKTVNKKITQKIIEEVNYYFESIKNATWWDLQGILKSFLELLDILSLLDKNNKNLVNGLKKEMEILIEKHLKKYFNKNKVAEIVEGEIKSIDKLEKLFSGQTKRLKKLRLEFLKSSMTT
jgi:hypothetical protein|tara:strand:+ start:575 stop:2101 length:1527 start_codon:yes stop_codon:yes gene_type:complete